MTKEEMAQLVPGDLVRPKEGETTWVVSQVADGKAVLVRSSMILNPDNWELVPKKRKRSASPRGDKTK